MGEQLKEEDWLPEGLPDGWKVEIRVRKSGKKDRYYTDPEYGYIFRSIKDIDRYLLTGKLGRHVTKTTKSKESSSDTVKSEDNTHTDESRKKESIKSGMTKSCLALAAHGQEEGECASKRKVSTRSHDSKEMSKKRISKPCTGNPSRSSKKKESTPFFILDSDQCDESDAIDIPNLSEIIDSIRKEKEDRKTVYVSAPAIGSLLAGQTSEIKAKQDHDIRHHFNFNICQHINISPNVPYMPSQIDQEQEWETKNNVRPYQHAPVVENFGKLGPERPIGVPGCALFGNLLLTDPCIDFAFKTLTGSMPMGNDTSLEDCFSSQQHGPCRT